MEKLFLDDDKSNCCKNYNSLFDKAINIWYHTLEFRVITLYSIWKFILKKEIWNHSNCNDLEIKIDFKMNHKSCNFVIFWQPQYIILGWLGKTQLQYYLFIWESKKKSLDVSFPHFLLHYFIKWSHATNLITSHLIPDNLLWVNNAICQLHRIILILLITIST